MKTKVRVTGESLELLITIVQSLLKFDHVVRISLSSSNILLNASNIWDTKVQHKFNKPFFSVIDASDDVSVAIVQTKSLCDAFETINEVGKSVKMTRCFFDNSGRETIYWTRLAG